MPDALAYLTLGRSLPDATLTVDVMAGPNRPPCWIAAILDLLRRTPGVRLRRVILAGGGPAVPRLPGLLGAYHGLAVRDAEAFQQAPPGALERLGVEIIDRADRWADVVRDDRADVLLALRGAPESGDCAGLARRAVWSFVLGDARENRRTPPFFHEVAGDSAVIPYSLIEHTARWDSGCILGQVDAPKQMSLYYLRGPAAALRGAGAMIARHLHDLLIDGDAAPRRHANCPETRLAPGSGAPTLRNLTGYLASRLWNSLLARTIRHNRVRQWFIAWRHDPALLTVNRREFAPDGFRCFLGRPGLGYADPFPFTWQGRELLFIEEIMPDERGRLVVTEIVDGREPDTPPAVILEKPYHLSYPFVFEHEGEFYLLPETAQNHAVDLYRATRFPEEWALHKRLVDGLSLVDTTPLFHDGHWYFFTSAQDFEQVPMESFLFVARQLDGAWTCHPANPVTSDSRRCRSAGRPFWWNGVLIRPVQDCSLDYGIAVRLMAVEKLSPEEYEEREIAVIDTSWLREAIRTHTLNHSARIEAIDGSRWVKAPKPGSGPGQ